jgi:hypothetical protein
MGVVYACAFSFMSKYLHQSCGPKPMTRVDINDNNQSSNTNQNSFYKKKSQGKVGTLLDPLKLLNDMKEKVRKKDIVPEKLRIMDQFHNSSRCHR